MFMSPNICAQGNCPLQQAGPNAFRIAEPEGEASIHLTSAMPQSHAPFSQALPMWLIACCRMHP